MKSTFTTPTCTTPVALALALLAMLLASPARAETGSAIDAAHRINAANDLVRSGSYDQALASYGQVAPTAGEQALLEYNRGVAQYRAGDIEAARSAFERASAARSAPLAAAARYNLGNCFYSDATQAAEQDPAAAIQALQQAIDHYRGSLAADPNLVDARANIELAYEWIKQLQQQMARQEQNQADEQPQEQDQSSGESSAEAAGSEDNQAHQEQQPESEPQADGSPGDKSQQQQSSSGEADGEQASAEEAQSGAESPVQSNPQSNPQSPASEQATPEQRQPEQRQPEQGESIEGDEPTDAAVQPPTPEPTPAPSGELAPANGADDEQPSAATGPMGEFKADAPPMTREEALKMLQAVRDRDMLRRLRQEQIERNQHVPTERDW